ncbi:MAG: nucleotide sugar dehydrogenase [Pseudomonadota bacterium]|nr:nucleotide sugar dehydrogenase [Pseudomonadota bacterium]
MLNLDGTRIAIIGLGYVGLPLAVEFGRRFPTVGYDISSARVAELREGSDSTLEATPEELAAAKLLQYSDDEADLSACNTYIVTVPTPVDEHRRPDLSPLKSASELLGRVIGKGDVVIYESTVFPGCTEEICIPIVEAVSNLKFNVDFFAGYSPERINPGDREHRLNNTVKVTSGSTPETADFVDGLYRLIVNAATHRASSIRVAEACKVIENTQRDLNIALVNELALIFNRLGIDTREVLDAAGTKWNFLKFSPGLVGGHCIGVDPYYLTHKAQETGYHPEVILAGRRINDGMGEYIAQQVIRLMIQRGARVSESRILILGATFKENCADLRNTRVLDLFREFQSYGASVDLFDPWASPAHVAEEFGVRPLKKLATGAYGAIVLAVPHRQFLEWGPKRIRGYGTDDCVLYDVKAVLPKESVDARL